MLYIYVLYFLGSDGCSSALALQFGCEVLKRISNCLHLCCGSCCGVDSDDAFWVPKLTLGIRSWEWTSESLKKPWNTRTVGIQSVAWIRWNPCSFGAVLLITVDDGHFWDTFWHSALLVSTDSAVYPQDIADWWGWITVVLVSSWSTTAESRLKVALLCIHLPFFF